MIKNVTILGARESGFGAAMLASKKGYNVFVSDINQIDDDKVMKVEKSKNYEDVVQKIVTKNKGLYFNNEIFVIEKK